MNDLVDNECITFSKFLKIFKSSEIWPPETGSQLSADAADAFADAADASAASAAASASWGSAISSGDRVPIASNRRSGKYNLNLRM